MDLRELAKEMVQVCPDCGCPNIRITRIEIVDKRYGFMWSNSKQVLRVPVDCPECGDVWNSGNGYADIDSETAQAYLNFRDVEAKKRRKLYALTDHY